MGVGADAPLGVLGGRAGLDDEVPVGRLEEEELSNRLVERHAVERLKEQPTIGAIYPTVDGERGKSIHNSGIPIASAHAVTRTPVAHQRAVTLTGKAKSRLRA